MRRSRFVCVLVLCGCRAAPSAGEGPQAEAAAQEAALRRFGGLGVQVTPSWPREPGPGEGARIEAFSARDARLQDVILTVFKDADVNVVLEPGIGDEVATFDIKGASLEEAFQQLLKTYDLAYRFDGDFLRIGRVARRVFDVDFPAIEVQEVGGDSSGGGSARDASATGGATAGSAGAAAAFWNALRSDLGKLLGNQDNVRYVANPAIGAVVVEGPPSSVQRVEAYLANARRRAARLVSIEARLLEVSLSDSLQVGVDWSLLPDFFNTDKRGGLPDGGVVGQSLSSAADALRIGLIKADTFSIFVDMLERQGQVRVLSNPRVSTLSNVPAQIRVVEQVPVIEREIIDAEGTSRTQFSVRFENAGVQVAVTPQIGEDGMITVHVQPSITEVSGFVTTPDNLVSEPILNTRSVEAIVRVADGQAAVIGGLRGTRSTEDLDKVPLLGDIPLLGALFRTTVQTRTRTELVIVLFPRILSPAWVDEDVERGLERTVAARVPYRQLTLALEEPEAEWRQPTLGGAPSHGDGSAPPPPLLRAPRAASRGVSRAGLAQLSVRRALRALDDDDESQAVFELEQALVLDGSVASAWVLRGLLDRRRNGNGQARAAFERAVRLGSDDGIALNNLGLLELSADNPVAAEGLFLRALAQAGDGFAAAHNNLGVARLRQGRHELARASFARALALDPELREAHVNLGVAADLGGDVAAAAEAYRRYLLAGGDINDPRLRALRARLDTLATHWQGR
ncbi:MAG: tetratricopeptide repeat protein [Planctomycetota bacterium]